ncbi:MAG: hypothetical protein JSW27_19735 [Phycisphaerales bacterium]|nr:MAG: hypothetical protein JSW27_19735 [Phycisphaerales bacterium]
MASEAQVRANRLNARKSTGPRTAEGKATVAQNAVKHGLRAEQMVIKGEDPGEFESYREQMLGELAPDGALESMLAERAVGLAWRLRRAERLQAEVFDTMLDDEETDPVRRLARSMRRKSAGDGASALGRVVTRDFGHAQVLYRLGMYERRIEHSLYKTLSELQKLRLVREIDEENHRQAELDAAARPTPQTPSRSADDQGRQTKPISRVTRPKTAKTGTGTFRAAGCTCPPFHGSGNLTRPGHGHRLGGVEIGRKVEVPAGMSPVRPPSDTSHSGKEQAR